MQEFFTWNLLATYAGGVLATGLITQMLKELPYIKALPTRLFSYIVALIVLLAATFFTDKISVSSIMLSMFNALIVGFASNGAYDAGKGVLSKK